MAHQHEHDCCPQKHGHESHDGEGHGHEHSPKKQLMLIAATAVLLAVAVYIEKTWQLPTWQLLLVYLVPYLLIGHDTLGEAAEGIMSGDPFNEHFLMSVATVGALCIGFLPGGTTEFPEAVFVMLFFQVGELFEGYAEGRSRKSVAHLMDIRPDVVHLADGTSPEHTVDRSPEEIPPGSSIVVRVGERIPLDGVIEEGSTSLNTVALTGESVPQDVAAGDDVASGCINLSGVIRVRTTRAYGESTVAKIISLVEHASERKSKSETFITRFARIYTPVVCFAALAIAVLPPLYLLLTGCAAVNLSTWVYRALLFLVVSCPCALVISVPLSFFSGIGGASRKGILIKGARYMDVLAQVGQAVFDKTGTLTKGQFAVTAVHPDHFDERQLLHLVAHVEHYSTHPIALALRCAFPEESSDGCRVYDVEELAGQGVHATVELPDATHDVYAGNKKLMETIDAGWHDCKHVGTIIHVAIDRVYAGHIVINDNIKEDSQQAIAELKALGVRKTVMLTGDREEVARDVAQRLGIDEYHAGLMPQDKVKFLEESLADSHEEGRRRHSPVTLFVGDGINDAPVLARADIGIAMGGLGSEAAIDAADVVIMDDHPSKVAVAIRQSRATLSIARQNVTFAIGVKVAVLLLAAFGAATMWMAVFADVGVTVLAVLNAMRAMKQG